MDSFKRSSSPFRYGLDSDPPDTHHGFSGVLEIYVHHARNIHNICIYDNQDVYAKFSLTYNPDDTISTRIVHRAGKNPEFNEKLMINVTQIDAVLKCEIWMMSRARHYMEDQLLGFALVPVSDIIGKHKVTHDYSLSSTDLFHSPAGTVKLTLSIINPSINSLSNPKINNTTSISSEVVLLAPQVSSEVELDPALEYTRIEFPDMNVVSENKQMVTEYFNGLNLRPNANANANAIASFLCLGSTHQPESDGDCDMKMILSEENPNGIAMFSPSGSFQNSEFLASSSTTTSVSDDRNTADSNEKKNHHSHLASPSSCSETPTSKTEIETRDVAEQEQINNRNKKEVNNNGGFGQILGDMNLEAEQTAMQKQIVDMYMRSMQQFTESLAKMKLPMDLHKPSLQQHHQEDQINSNTNNNKIQNQSRTNRLEIEKKKDGSRVFYGSRAFF